MKLRLQVAARRRRGGLEKEEALCDIASLVPHITIRAMVDLGTCVLVGEALLVWHAKR